MLKAKKKYRLVLHAPITTRITKSQGPPPSLLGKNNPTRIFIIDDKKMQNFATIDTCFT